MRRAVSLGSWSITLPDDGSTTWNTIELVSGEIGEDIAVEAMVAGADDYVLKSRLRRLGPALARSLEAARGRQRDEREDQEAAQDAVLDNGVLKCWNNTAAAIAQFGDLYPGCVPINTFGNNVTTQQQVDYWSRNTHFNETNIMDDLAADISGEVFQLPAGPVRVALAGEMRWLDYTIDSNASPTQVVNCTGLRLCGNAAGKGFAMALKYK